VSFVAFRVFLQTCSCACSVLVEICQLPSEAGPCFASKRRYFFDTASSTCQLFTYGGCKGNANRFLTLENCQRVCGTLWPAVTRVESEAVITTAPARTEIESDGRFKAVIHLLHLNDTHLNSYSIPSWYSWNRTWAYLDSVWKTPLWFVAALVNKLVPWCAWLLSSALEILRLWLRLRLRLLNDLHYLQCPTVWLLNYAAKNASTLF